MTLLSLEPNGDTVEAVYTLDGVEYRATITLNEDKLADLVATAIGRHDHSTSVGNGAFVVSVVKVGEAGGLFGEVKI